MTKLLGIDSFSDQKQTIVIYLLYCLYVDVSISGRFCVIVSHIWIQTQQKEQNQIKVMLESVNLLTLHISTVNILVGNNTLEVKVMMISIIQITPYKSIHPCYSHIFP